MDYIDAFNPWRLIVASKKVPEIIEDAPVMGRPPHVPTEDTRQRVKNMVWSGFTLDKVAGLIGISEGTLVKYYRHEIDEANGHMMANIGQSIYQKAMNGDTTAMIFIAKTRLGWREKPTEIELSGKDGAAIAIEDKSALTTKLMAAVAAMKKSEDKQ